MSVSEPLLHPWPGNCPAARCVLSQIRAIFKVKGRGQELNAATLLYVHHLCNTQTTTRERCEWLFSAVDDEVSEGLCIKSKVTQGKCREPGFEPRFVGASPDEAFPSEYCHLSRAHLLPGI